MTTEWDSIREVRKRQPSQARIHDELEKAGKIDWNKLATGNENEFEWEKVKYLGNPVVRYWESGDHER
jgi:hypothetical protein